jgi:hypothetical protein
MKRYIASAVLNGNNRTTNLETPCQFFFLGFFCATLFLSDGILTIWKKILLSDFLLFSHVPNWIIITFVCILQNKVKNMNLVM